MEKVVSVTALDGYRLDIVFSDGVRGTISLAEELTGPMFEPLRSQSMFSSVYVDEFGAVAWPNGADLDPYALHAELKAKACHV